MNRQIKFRAKVVKHNPMTNPDNGWVEGFYCQDLSNGEIKHYIHNCPMTWEVDPTTIGQFVGLTDKDGVEVCEGDMLECPRVPTIPLEVYYNSLKGAFCLAEHTHTEGVLKGTTPIGEMFMHYPDMYIIGNIHDNKTY